MEQWLFWWKMHSKIFWLKDQLYHDRQNLAAEMILSYQLLFYQIIFLATHVACGLPMLLVVLRIRTLTFTTWNNKTSTKQQIQRHLVSYEKGCFYFPISLVNRSRYIILITIGMKHHRINIFWLPWTLHH